MFATALLVASVLTTLGAGTESAFAATTPDLPSLFTLTSASVPVKGAAALSTISRDGNANTALADGRGFWAYADTGYRRPNGSWGFVSSSGTYASATTPQTMADRVTSDGSLTQFIPTGTSSCAGGSIPLYWPRSAAASGVTPNEDVYVFYEHVCDGVGQRTGVARYRVASTGTVRATVLNANIFGPGNQPGSAAAARPGVNYVYVYWSAGANLRVGRVAPASIGDASAYRYWNGSSWVANPSSAVGTNFQCCQKPSVQWISSLNKWALVDYAGPYGSSSDVNRGRGVLQFADNPQGPFGQRYIFDLPGCNPAGSANATSSDCRAIEIVPSASSAAEGIGVAYHNPRADSGLNVSGFEDGQTQITRVRISPFGSLERAAVGLDGKVTLVGWGIEPETTGPVNLMLSIDGGAATSIGSAGLDRSDIASRYPAYGGAHGFSVSSISVPAGQHTLCVTATNIGVGSATSLGCKSVWSQAALTTVAPKRLYDSRSTGTRSQISVGGFVDVLIGGASGVPANATGAVVNVTSAGATGGGYLTAYPAGRPRPTTSVLNFTNSGATAALVTSGLDTTKKVRIYVGGSSTHVIVDLFGYYTASGPTATGRSLAVTPTRIFDSRQSGRMNADQTRTVQVTGIGGIPANGVSAAIVNLTMTRAATTAYASVWAGGAAVPSPLTSNINVTAGDTRANQVIAPVGAGGSISIRTNQLADVVVDVVGYVTSSTASASTVGLFVATEPERFLDTRGGARRAAGSDVALTVGGRGSVPSGAGATIGSLTAVLPTSGTYVTAYPFGTARPFTSNLNLTAANQIRANHVTSKLVSNQMRLYNANTGGATHLVFDVAGWLTP